MQADSSRLVQVRYRPPLPPHGPPSMPHPLLQADYPVPQMGLPPLPMPDMAQGDPLMPAFRAHTLPAAAAPLHTPGTSVDLGNPQVSSAAVLAFNTDACRSGEMSMSVCCVDSSESASAHAATMSQGLPSSLQ